MTEIEKLDWVKTEFDDDCRCRLYSKYNDGFRGWNTKRMEQKMFETMGRKMNLVLMQPDLAQKHLVDIANLAMFLWNLKRGGNRKIGN